MTDKNCVYSSTVKNRSIHTGSYEPNGWTTTTYPVNRHLLYCNIQILSNIAIPRVMVKSMFTLVNFKELALQPFADKT